MSPFKVIKNGVKPKLFPIQKEITKTIMEAAARKKKGLLDIDQFLTSEDKPASRKIKSFGPKTANQASYVELMRDDKVDIIVAIGPAGTGKTMLACYAAVESLRLGKIGKIVITRPVVSVDEEIGFLPGNVESKMDPWTRPVFDVLRETYTAKEIDQMLEEGVLEIVPLGFMRGRTFKDAWIVADEMQNSTPTQMLMLATRIGEGSKMVITGDLNQSDRPGPNGLHEIYGKIQSSSSQEYIKSIVLESEDVQRSRAAKAILNLYADKPDPEGPAPAPTPAPTPPPTPSSSTRSHSSDDGLSCDIEWINLNNSNDAALIPRNHFYPSPPRNRNKNPPLK